jgi:hypothetical protein
MQQPRELIELLRAVGEAVKEDRAALDARAVVVEARIGTRVDRRIGGIARDEFANLFARGFERCRGYTRSSRRMRV